MQKKPGIPSSEDYHNTPIIGRLSLDFSLVGTPGSVPSEVISDR